jgi:hypothetical protein
VRWQDTRGAALDTERSEVWSLAIDLQVVAELFLGNVSRQGTGMAVVFYYLGAVCTAQIVCSAHPLFDSFSFKLTGRICWLGPALAPRGRQSALGRGRPIPARDLQGQPGARPWRRSRVRRAGWLVVLFLNLMRSGLAAVVSPDSMDEHQETTAVGIDRTKDRAKKNPQRSKHQTRRQTPTKNRRRCLNPNWCRTRTRT